VCVVYVNAMNRLTRAAPAPIEESRKTTGAGHDERPRDKPMTGSASAEMAQMRPRTGRPRPQAEHGFERHSSFTESPLGMSDNRSYVNYTHLHGQNTPSTTTSPAPATAQSPAPRDGEFGENPTRVQYTPARV
jgi:hypothetical protein